MVKLTNKTSIALLIALLKQNYGQAWYTKGYYLTVGLHLPNGEVAYKIPAQYEEYFKGMIELPVDDTLTGTTKDDSADRLLEWSKTV